MGKSLCVVIPLINTGLQPGAVVEERAKPFQRFSCCEDKPLKRLGKITTMITGLKPGVNENLNSPDTACVSNELN